VETLTWKHKAASLVDSASVPTIPAIRVEPKPRSGIRQQVLVKSIVEVKPKRPRISETTSCSGVAHSVDAGSPSTSSRDMGSKSISTTGSPREVPATDTTKTQGGLLGLAYESEDDSDAELEETPMQRNSTGTSKVAQGLLVRGSLDANRLESLNDHSRSDVKLGGIS